MCIRSLIPVQRMLRAYTRFYRQTVAVPNENETAVAHMRFSGVGKQNSKHIPFLSGYEKVHMPLA